MKIGFYHHGHLPKQKDAEVVNEVGMKVFSRNAATFKSNEKEAFDRVVVDQGANTDAILAAYKDKAQTLEDFAKNPPKGDVAKAMVKAFDPDKPVEKAAPKKQG